MKQQIQTKRFYQMDKSLQLIEGTTVAALWAHLRDAHNFFLNKGMIKTENTLFQSSKAIQAFTGIGIKAQGTARKRLEELGFLKFKVAAIPGHATKSTFYILYPDAYEKWVDEHDYDELRDEKYHELQDSTEHDKLDQWIKDNMSPAQKQTLKRMNQKQSAVGTFANHTEGHLQDSPGHISKTPKDTVIDTVLIETIEVDNTQKSKSGCVYPGDEFPYLKGKTKGDLFKLIVEYYQSEIVKHHPEYNNLGDLDEERFIGNLESIEKEFMKLEIDTAINCYIAILGYLFKLESEIYENPRRFTAAYRLEGIIKFKRKEVMTKANMITGSRVANGIHAPKESEMSL